MTTDVVEKCARAIHAESDDRRFNWDSLQGVQRDDFRDMALAVIDALADGVSENQEMVEAFLAAIKLDQSINETVAAKFITPMQGKCRREEMRLIASDGLRAMFAAIRAAKSREG